MDTNFYNSRLRYLDADDIDDSAIDFDGLDVRGPDNSKLGDLDGFVLDSTSGRVYYAVVDSGGWFTSRRFLLPIGHARLDHGRRALEVDVTKDAIRRYPEFDADRFRTFSDGEMRAFEQRMAVACCPDEETGSVDAAIQHDTVRHYSQPDWWKREYFSPDHSRDVARVADRDLRDINVERVDRSRETAQPAQPERERYEREQVTARDRSRDGADISPHGDRRAQPGDILGIETGGDQSHLGEDADDENKRRRDAERAAVRGDRD